MPAYTNLPDVSCCLTSMKRCWIGISNVMALAHSSQPHQRAFEAYVERGINIKRLSPQIKEYDLKQLSKALDPSSDWEFDYLGVQTLYDRYLIVDKTGRSMSVSRCPSSSGCGSPWACSSMNKKTAKVGYQAVQLVSHSSLLLKYPNPVQ